MQATAVTSRPPSIGLKPQPASRKSHDPPHPDADTHSYCVRIFRIVRYALRNPNLNQSSLADHTVVIFIIHILIGWMSPMHRSDAMTPRLTASYPAIVIVVVKAQRIVLRRRI